MAAPVARVLARNNMTAEQYADGVRNMNLAEIARIEAHAHRITTAALAAVQNSDPRVIAMIIQHVQNSNGILTAELNQMLANFIQQHQLEQVFA